MEEVPPRTIEAKLMLMMVLLLFVTGFLLTATNYNASTYGFARKQKQQTTEDSIIYGHVHIAKTAGSGLLNILAYKYERVCSNKANSILLRQSKSDREENCYGFGTSWDHRRDFKTRLDECDYVSIERSSSFWTKQSWSNRHLELHVPCKDPLELLMSSCFHGPKPSGFDCSDKATLDIEQIGKQVKKCLKVVEKDGISRRIDFRFDEPFLISALKHNINVKCYNTDLTFGSYLSYMDQRLTCRNSTFPTNTMCQTKFSGRNRTSECIWQNEALKTQVKKYLLENHFYFAYCKKCLGSSEDLFQEIA